MADATTPDTLGAKLAWLTSHGCRLGSLPVHMHESIADYLLFGRPVGGFLTALLSNDLKQTVARADDINRDCLLAWVRFMHNDMPSSSQGSPERVAAWMESGGLIGRAAASDAA